MLSIRRNIPRTYIDLLPGKELKTHYEVKVYIYTKERKHSNDMLVLCLPQGQLKICKVNMVEGRFELFKSSATGQGMPGKNKPVEKTLARHVPTKNFR